MNVNPFEEFIKCKEDFSYFAENYLKINKTGKILPFKLFDYQKRLIECYNKEQYVVALKFRQSGITTLNLLYAFWKCTFCTNHNIAILVKTQNEAKHLEKFIDFTINNLPEWFPIITKQWSCNKFFKMTNSKLYFVTFQQMRGTVFDYIFIDEIAFFDNLDENFFNQLSSVTANTKIFISSTTNKNWFEKFWNDTVQRRNSFYPFHCSHTEHPYYSDPENIKILKNVLGEKGFKQEILCEFINESSENLSNEELINMLQSSNMTDKDLLNELVERFKFLIETE